MQKRQLLYEPAIKGFQCSVCGWIWTIPRWTATEFSYERAIGYAFERHECGELEELSVAFRMPRSGKPTMRRGDEVRVKGMASVDQQYRGTVGKVTADCAPGEPVNVEFNNEVVTHSFNASDLELLT